MFKFVVTLWIPMIWFNEIKLLFVTVENYNKICNVLHSNVNDEHSIECNSISEQFYVEYFNSFCYQLFVISEQFFVATAIELAFEVCTQFATCSNSNRNKYLKTIEAVEARVAVEVDGIHLMSKVLDLFQLPIVNIQCSILQAPLTIYRPLTRTFNGHS